MSTSSLKSCGPETSEYQFVDDLRAFVGPAMTQMGSPMVVSLLAIVLGELREHVIQNAGCDLKDINSVIKQNIKIGTDSYRESAENLRKSMPMN